MRTSFVAAALIGAKLATCAPAPSPDSQPGTDLTNISFTSTPLQFDTGTPTKISGNPPKNGTLNDLAAPFMPSGGNMIKEPVYRVKSNFDFQSLTLALNQELIELDLFHNGLAKFSVADFEAAGLSAEDRFLIEFMADQEVGHAIVIANMLGNDVSPRICEYQYPYTTVQEFVLFCQLVTRIGESGTYGFLSHLDSRPAAQIITQNIAIEARQQLIFRQFQGLFPMPVWFEPAITQSMQWTLLAPYIKSCPKNNPRVQWQNFPALHITNQPYALGGTPAITQNRTLTSAGRTINFQWDNPGQHVGPNNSYVTSTTAGKPKFAAFVSQLNVTYIPLQNITGNTAFVFQPGQDSVVFPGDPLVNGTMFVALTDSNPFVTPYNLTLINTHIAAGPAVYQSG